MNEGPDAQDPQALTWRAAAPRVLKRYAMYALLWPPAALAAWFMFESMFSGRFVWMAFSVTHQIVGLALPFIILASIRQEVLDEKSEVRRLKIASIIDGFEAGVIEKLKPKPKETRRFLDYRSRRIVVVLFLGVFGLFAAAVQIADEVGSFSLPIVTMLFAAPALIATLAREAHRYEAPAVIREARNELIYGRLVGDRAQLAGSLVLDEHARGAQGGALTVQVQAGGLELQEEVALDLDSEEEIRHSEAFHVEHSK